LSCEHANDPMTKPTGRRPWAYWKITPALSCRQGHVIGVDPHAVRSRRGIVPGARHDLHVQPAFVARRAIVALADQEDLARLADPAHERPGHIRRALARRGVATRRSHVLARTLRPQ